MKIEDIADFTKGWFIGDFEPSLFKTTDFEIAIKSYQKGDTEKAHYHAIATEWTVVVKGKVSFQREEEIFVVEEGKIFQVDPGETFTFSALEDSKTLVVKIPSVRRDKFEK